MTDAKRKSEPRPGRLDEDICIHLFTVASTMVGICLTAIGLLHVVIANRRIDTFADDLLTIDAILFLIASLTAYAALRTRRRRRHVRLEHAADAVFIAAMILTVAACILITFWLNVV